MPPVLRSSEPDWLLLSTLSSFSSQFPCHLTTLPVELPKLAGAEGFEPPSPVLETGSLTVELTPLSSLKIADFRMQIGKSKIFNLKPSITSLLYAACASGR